MSYAGGWREKESISRVLPVQSQNPEVEVTRVLEFSAESGLGRQTSGLEGAVQLLHTPPFCLFSLFPSSPTPFRLVLPHPSPGPASLLPRASNSQRQEAVTELVQAWLAWERQAARAGAYKGAHWPQGDSQAEVGRLAL